MFYNFDDLVNEVMLISNDEEKRKVKEEVDLFVERNWEKYILFIVNVTKDFYADKSGSAMDSYLIRKAIDTEFVNTKLLHSERAKQILENDALRLNMHVYWMKMALNEKLIELDSILETNLRELGLFKKESLITHPHTNGSYDMGTQYYIVSQRVITDEDMRVITNEVQQSDEYETKLLREHLIIKIRVTESGI